MAELKNSMGVTFDHISSVRVSGKEHNSNIGRGENAEKYSKDMNLH